MAAGLLLSTLASIAALANLLAEAISKVRDGKGFNTYRTFWLVEFSYVGFLVLVGSIVVALLVAAVLSWRIERQWRAFEKKYETRKQVR